MQANRRLLSLIQESHTAQTERLLDSLSASHEPGLSVRAERSNLIQRLKTIPSESFKAMQGETTPLLLRGVFRIAALERRALYPATGGERAAAIRGMLRECEWERAKAVAQQGRNPFGYPARMNRIIHVPSDGMSSDDSSDDEKMRAALAAAAMKKKTTILSRRRRKSPESLQMGSDDSIDDKEMRAALTAASRKKKTTIPSRRRRKRLESLLPTIIRPLIDHYTATEVAATIASLPDTSLHDNALEYVVCSLPPNRLGEGAEIVERIANASIRDGAVSHLATELFHADRADEARSFAESITGAEKRSWAFSHLGRVHEAARAAEEIEDLSLQSKRLSGVVNEFLDKEMSLKAVQVARRIPDEEVRSEALSSIVNHLALGGEQDPEQALKIAPLIEDEMVRSQSLIWVVNGFIRKGNMKRASEVADGIADVKLCSEASRLVATALFNAEGVGKASRTARRIADPEERSKALLYMQLFHEAATSARAIPDHTLRSKVLFDIAKSLFYKGMQERAIEIAETIPDETLRSKVLFDIAESLLYKETLERAIEIAETIPDEAVRCEALNRIRLVESDEFDFF